MRAKIREILDDCIADGLRSGYHRAHKYYDDPCEEQVISYMDDHIWLEIDRKFDFERNVCDEVVEGFDEVEAMRRKCIVKDCQNHAHQGGFTGDLCNPCYDFISKGTGVYSQAYRNAQPEWVGLTEGEFKELLAGVCWFHKSRHEDVSDLRWFSKIIEAKLKEKNR